MGIQLDHVFILTDRPDELADTLLALAPGFRESPGRNHKGQGTSNRRFEFADTMLEILFLRDSGEANNGPAKNLKLEERVRKAQASPFGIILTRHGGQDTDPPFPGWQYQPDYFEPPNAFHIGENSSILEEPLCIFVPFNYPERPGLEEKPPTLVLHPLDTVSKVQLVVPRTALSETLQVVRSADRLQVDPGTEHLMVVTLNSARKTAPVDLRPDFPLVFDTHY